MGPKQKQKSKDLSREADEISHESFSPVPLRESSGHQKQGNLTGSARKLKDGAADMHNLLMKWNNLNVDGFNIVNDIANIKLECILTQDDTSSTSQQASSKLPTSLLPLCDQLLTVLKKLENVTIKLNGIQKIFQGVKELEQYRQCSGDQQSILFQTWDISRYVVVVTELLGMYSQELRLKQSIAERICHATDRSSIMFFTAAWLHEPYIEDRAKLLLESLLVETGHKRL